MKTFPKPLTAQEEKFYLEKYKQGDMEAKDILIERNMRLVAHIAKKYPLIDEEIDDIISIGTIGLIKAVSTFDSEKGNRLATYAARCIDNEILMLIRSKKKMARDVYLHEPIGLSREGDEISLMDILECKEAPPFEQVKLREDIKKLYEVLSKELSPREKMIITLRYGLYGEKEYTQREIAQKLDISRSYVSRIEKNAILKIKKHF